MQAYAEMKSADSVWLDEVPAHWVVSRFRYEAAINGGQVDPREAPWRSMTLLAPNHIESNTGHVASIESAEDQGADSGKYLVEQGQLVYSKIRPALNKAAIAETEALCSADMYAISFRDQVEPRFALHYVLGRPFHTFATVSSLRVKMPKVNREELADVPWLVPPLEEQRAIADYLDRETARIDTLIEEQQRLIEMLRGRRKAVVEQAVFSGLDDVPTTSNPEPWLPDTPAPWTVVQLGFLSDTLAGYAFSSDGFSADDEHVPLLRGVNVKPGLVDWSDVVYWDAQTRPVPVDYELRAGDLVFGMDRPFVTAGVRVAPVADDDLPALLLQRVMRIRSNEDVNGSYLRYVVGTDAFLDYLEPLFTGVSVPHVSEWQVRKFKMPCPPLDEQGRIAEHLDLQTAKIDELILESERLIELSRERRSALVTAAVTGQIDVREVA